MCSSESHTPAIIRVAPKPQPDIPNPGVKALEQSSAIITVVRNPSGPLGKQFSRSPDDSINKKPAANLAKGVAVMHHVETPEELAALFRTVGDDPSAAIINAAFDGIEVGETFLILSAWQIEKDLNIPRDDRERQKGVHQVTFEQKSYKALGRFKENVRPSCWQYLDRDIDEHTPQEIASLSDDEWIAAVGKVMPGFANTSYCRVTSTSSRVLLEGEPVGAGNAHVWFKVQNPDDIERFRTAFVVRAAELGMTWLKPRYSRSERGKIIGQSLTTLADTSVFTAGRMTFVGKPVVTGDLTVAPQSASVQQGKLDAFDTSTVFLPDKKVIKEITRGAGVEMTVQSTGNGLVTHIHDLTLDTIIETEGNETLTVRKIIESGENGKIRCQTPFRESSSFAALLSFNEDEIPFVHDVGTGITHWLTESEQQNLKFSAAKLVMEKVQESTQEDCGAPFEVASVQALALIRDSSQAEYHRIRDDIKQRNRNVSVVALDQAVLNKKAEVAVAETHHGYACSLIDRLTTAGHAPVGHSGQLYIYDPDEGIWIGKPTDALVRMVAEAYDGLGNCKRYNDYKNVAEHAISLASDPNFFADAPVGLATQGGFYGVHDSEIKVIPLSADHRQRVKISIIPEEQATPLFNQFLKETFASSVPEVMEQQLLLIQEVVGAIMLGNMHQFQKAVMFYDPFGRAGKGTLERCIRELVPSTFVTAISPFNWSKEYYLASLAGARLNVVGELPEHESIPAAAFKTVTGGDLLTGRHPNHRTITFKNEAAHLFMTNHLINTRDHSEAFYSRWLIIEFPNSRLRSGLPIDPSLADRIIEHEMPGIAYWALQGAISLLGQNAFSGSLAHDRLMAKWRVSTNSLEEFIHECCEVGDDSYTVRRSELYRAYRVWCKDSGKQPFSKSRVKDLLMHNLGLGIRLVELNGYETFRGIRKKPETFAPLTSVPGPPKDVTF